MPARHLADAQAATAGAHMWGGARCSGNDRHRLAVDCTRVGYLPPAIASEVQDAERRATVNIAALLLSATLRARCSRDEMKM